MRRRPFLALAFTIFAGCALDGSARNEAIPEECSVDKLDASGPPPAELDRDSARSYVEAYEEAYIEATEIDGGRHGRVEGPGANVLDVSPVDGGYHVHVETSWTVRQKEDDELVFEAIEVAEREPVTADHDAIATNSVLQNHIEQAAGGERSSVLRESHGAYEETYAGIMAAAGEIDGVVIEYGDRLVEVTEREGPEIVGDGYEQSSYFVAPGVLYRSDHNRDPRDGVPLECRSLSTRETRP